jgi:hypothetical protein
MEQKVICPSCGSVNNAGQQFCGACGAKLGGEVQEEKIACPSCGFQNPAGQQFCGACGAKLAGEGEPEVVSERQPEVVRVVEPVASPRQAEVKPTWGLAWGLYWRMMLLGLLIGGAAYLIFAIVWLALGHQFAPPSGF